MKDSKESKKEKDGVDFALSAEVIDFEYSTAFRAQPVLHRHDFLTDSGASVHLTQDRFRFEEDYTESGVFPLIKVVGGLVRPQGRGTVILKCRQSNGALNNLILKDTLYLPNSGVNLFSGKKLLRAGGVIRQYDLLDPKGNQLCRIDEELFIIEEP